MKEDILEVLTKDEYLSTNNIAKLIGKNWYKVEFELMKLKEEGKVGRIRISREIGWIKK